MRSTKTRSLTIAVVSDRFGTSIRTGIELPESTTSQIATPAASWTAGRLIRAAVVQLRSRFDETHWFYRRDTRNFKFKDA